MWGSNLIQWNDYLTARKSGIKKQWKALLDEKICLLEAMQGEQLKAAVHDMCVAYFDKNCTAIPIAHPRILKIILAQWREEIALNNEQYLLWAYKGMGINGVYDIVQLKKPAQLLHRILVLNPNNQEAKKLLLLDYLNSLDFALHELPHGLVLNESVCIDLIEKAQQLIDENPELAEGKTRFGANFKYYKKLYFDWIEYRDKHLINGFNT